MTTATTLRSTTGTCSRCGRSAPSRVELLQDGAFLVKECPEHGATRQLLSRHPEEWADLDRFYFQVNGDRRPQRDYLVRMTERCNLSCPICLAEANDHATPDMDLDALRELLAHRRGIKVDLLAAEPTVRRDLLDWVRAVKESGNAAALHTNGLKLVDRDLVRRLKEAGVDEVFVQFDGFDPEADRRLRGRDLQEVRRRCLDNLREVGLATSLVTVIGRGVNEAEAGRVLAWSLRPENRFIREVLLLGLRLMGRARDPEAGLAPQALMPDEMIDLLVDQRPELNRRDIHHFNKLYFTLLSVFGVKKCLYVQHYLYHRPADGEAEPIAARFDLAAAAAACERYARRLAQHPVLARTALMADLARLGLRHSTLAMVPGLVRLQDLLRTGMVLDAVPERFLLVGFITACDLHNYDAAVAANCGKGELSVDLGLQEEGAWANVLRERAFMEGDAGAAGEG